MGELRGTQMVDQREQMQRRWSPKNILTYRNAREEEKQAEDNKVQEQHYFSVHTRRRKIQGYSEKIRHRWTCQTTRKKHKVCVSAQLLGNLK